MILHKLSGYLPKPSLSDPNVTSSDSEGSVCGTINAVVVKCMENQSANRGFYFNYSDKLRL